jgi:amino acid adenylation domain-containing protein
MNSSVPQPHAAATAPASPHENVAGAGPAATPADEFPLSFAQQRLWFLAQLEGASAAYNVRLPVRLTGPLDLARLQSALDQLVARHEALRTTIGGRNGTPVQVIASHREVPIEFVDMSGVTEAAVRRKVAELSGTLFELGQGPLIRAFLVRIAPADHVLLLLTHHVISDAWSSGLLFRDLAGFYSALVAGREADLPALPVQHADYAVWQREWLQGAELEHQAAYWRQRLAGAPPLLALPTDRPRPAQQSHRGSRWTRIVSRELTAAVKSAAVAEGCTLFMWLLAAFDVLLARYAGQSDIVVGTPVAGRRRTELENVVGSFANTLVMRADLSGNPTFRQLLAQVRQSSLEAFAHQDLPFEKLVEALQPVRNLSHAPLFQVMFILQNTPWEAVPMAGIEVSPAETDAAAASKFDLTLSATEYEGQLWCGFEYCTDLFDAATIERLGGHFENLLRATVADPSLPVGDLPLQGAEQVARLDREWNATDSAVDRTRGAHHLVVACAAAQPASPAIECGEQRWSYAKLDDWSDQLAHRLRTSGVGRGEVVGICLDRSPEMVGAMLAVWKAGAAYLPLDPSFPAGRLDYMLSDSGCQRIVTSRSLVMRLPAGDARHLCIDDLAPGDCVTGTPLAATLDPGDLAYLIYTSGSTGQPKGVRITHGAVTNFLASMAHQPGFAAADRLLAVTTLSFDIAVLELLLPLTRGGTVVIAAALEARDGSALARLLDERRINVMQATPSTWRTMLAAGWRGKPDLKVLCGGEALDAALAAQLLARAGSVWNMYGPTETTVWSACGRITDASRITVGRPIANTQVHVLDARGRQSPTGVPGELCIGGFGLAEGYHQRPELTAEKFIVNPVGSARSTRLYRTGDRARWLADGTIQVLGRFDDQLKLRGFRIEPGEVEGVLVGQAGVSGCAVGLREGPNGDARLVAWVVADSGAELDVAALRGGLQRVLPEYMVPSHFEVVTALPLTPNGKVDRAALPGPDWGRVVRAAAQAPARDAVEEALCALYAEVLGVATVGIHEDFFALGGHSLLAVQLVSRIRDALDVELPLKALFESPTVAGVAGRLSGATLREAPVMRRGAGQAVALSWTQQRLWFLEQLTPGSAAYHLQSAFRLSGPLDIGALRAAVQTVVARHEALRTTFIERDGEVEQRIAAQCTIPLEVESGEGWSEARIGEHFKGILSRRFDLGSGPLLRLHLLRTAAQEHRLLVVMHHIVSDGWSLGVLFRELSVAYAAHRRKAPPQLPPLPVQYADYALWQRRWLESGELERQLAYWRRQLAGSPPLMHLPTDRPRLPVERHRGARLSRQIPASIVAPLKSLARAEGCTLYMVLLAGLDAVLARYTGDEELVVGTPVAGRPRTELEGLIGFFVNTLVLRVSAAGNPTFRELLGRVKRTALEAYAHPDVPFERLVDELKPPRDPGRTPLFQVMFNLHSEPAQPLTLDGLAMSTAATPRDTAKFDLSISAGEYIDGLGLVFEYNTDLFDAETVEWLCGSFVEVLRGVGRDAGVRLGDLALLDEWQRGRLAAERARVRLPAVTVRWPVGATLQGRFARQAEARGARPAVVWAQGQWSYAELAQRAGGIAAALSERCGSGSGRVGLLLGHDGPMVAGVLGVLWAGKAYVPLDPYAPAARNGWILADAGVEAVVVDEARLGTAPWLQEMGLPLVRADVPYAGAVIGACGNAEDLAYILYTSGSTGRPKGVLQRQSHVLAHIRTWTQQLHLTAEDRISLFSGYGFDAAVQDIFGAVLNGATLYPLDLRGGEAPSRLVDRIADHQLTVLHATPTVYRHLFGGRVTCRQDLTRVRLVVLGGEPARRSDLELFKVRFARGARFVNGLGLTECTMGLQWWADHDTRVLGQVLPVGTAVGEIHARISPEGAWQGELILEGAALALGYLNDEALSAERFSATARGQRRYATGDVVRKLPDGQLLHLGRADRQVKVRGMRIEPAEIEAVLAAQPGLSECVVVPREDSPGEIRLLGYVAGAGLDATVLRTALRQQLPEYAVPELVMLDGLPRRANGKVDLQALPEPQQPSAAVPVPARTEIETRLAELWCGVLQRESIGIHDDFFALGGHSLLATRLIARVRDAFCLEVPLLALFENPTIGGMAEALERTAARVERDIPALRRRARGATMRR